MALSLSRVPGQDMLRGIVTTTWGDVAEIKRKAEAGDPGAQQALGNILATRFRHADALQWYEKAARQGDLESFYQMGHLRLFGATGIPQDQAVAATPREGVQLVFRAATNGQWAAAHDMYQAYKEGRGVNKDPVQAYAWLQLYTDTAPPAFLPNKIELNQLALDVNSTTSQEGKRLAALYRAGKWPTLVLQPEPIPAKLPPGPLPGIRLNGIATGKNPIAIINGKSLAAGETATLSSKGGTHTIKCLKIGPDSVLVSVDGESEARELHLK